MHFRHSYISTHTHAQTPKQEEICLYGLLNKQWKYFLTEGVVYKRLSCIRPTEFTNRMLYVISLCMCVVGGKWFALVVVWCFSGATYRHGWTPHMCCLRATHAYSCWRPHQPAVYYRLSFIFGMRMECKECHCTTFSMVWSVVHSIPE